MSSSARWLVLLPGLLALSVGTAYAQCGSRFVATTGRDAANDCLTQGQPCLTIQHAVDVDAGVPCSGDTVNVAAGTYTEQVTIGTVLNLVGAGTATTTIKAPVPLVGTLDIVTIGTGATVELSGFTVSGPVPPVGACATDLGAGIEVLVGGTANIHDNTIVDVRHEPLDGCQEGDGISVIPPGHSSEAATATIVNNTIARYEKDGIAVRGMGSTAMVTMNTVSGVGLTPPTAPAQNGIEVLFGASATVTGNTVSDNECAAPGVCGPTAFSENAVGILLFAAAPGTAVTGNSVMRNDIGIYNNSSGTTLITGNTLADNRFDGILLEQGNATVDFNTIDPGLVGILVVSLNGSTANSTGTLTCNHISQATQAGIRLLIENGSTFEPVATASFNSITGNATGLDNTTTSSVNARHNWWGCSLGPGHTGCDPVSGPVDFTSPLAEPPPCAFPPTTTTTSTTTTVTPATTTSTIAPQCLADASCSDGNICNGIETCQAGVCTAGTPLNCDDGDPCTVDSCEPTSGCQHTPVANLASCSTVIPGGGDKKSDCYVFADVEGMHPVNKDRTTLVCADGDPSCDTDGMCNNVCALKVRLCINSPTLPPCTPPSQLASLKFKSYPKSFTLNSPGLLTGAQCGAFNTVYLPVKVATGGKKSTGVLKLTATAKAPKGKKPQTDSDTYLLKCKPGCAP
jgi:parallel beta-helix repeat protein